MIVNKQKIESTQGTDESSKQDTPKAEPTWKFIKDHGKDCLPKLFPPKLIISLIDDADHFFKNQRLLKSVLFDLVKAVECGGELFHNCYKCLSRCVKLF